MSNFLWVSKYQPKKLEDLIITDGLLKVIQEAKKNDETLNLLFSGPAGTGKTSSANIIINELKCNHLYVNGSLTTGIDFVRDEIDEFASNFGIFDEKKKIVFMDEADRLSSNAQDAMKGVVEKVDDVTRFIYTTNEVSKIIEPLRSRCIEFDFGDNPATKKELVIKFFERVKWILKQEDVDFDEEIILQFIVSRFPDFRKTLQDLQKYSIINNKKLDQSLLSFSSHLEQNQKFLEIIKSKDFKKIRKGCTEVNTESFYKYFCASLEETIELNYIPNVIILIAEYLYRQESSSVNREITLMAFICKILEMKVKFLT